MKNKIISIIILLSTLGLLMACNENHNHSSEEDTSESQSLHDHEKGHEIDSKADPHHDEHNEQPHSIHLTPQQIQDYQIKFDTLSSQGLSPTLTLGGQLELNPSKTSHLTSRFPGQVQKVYKELGQWVQKGEALIIVESNHSLQNFTISSPRSGYIIEKHVVPGENIEASHQLMTIASTSELWLILNAYPKDLPSIKKQQLLNVVHPTTGTSLQGKIDWISPQIDPISQSTQVRAQVKAPNSLWKPGLKIQAHIQIEPSDKSTPPLDLKTLPKSAVQNIKGEDVIFIPGEEPQEYQLVKVRIQKQTQTHVQISTHLKSGTRVISQGSFYLKSEILKSEMGDGHNH